MGPTDSTSPRNMPPTMAPGMLPMPPRTAAVKALMPGMKPVKKLIWMNIRPKSTPATPGHGGADGEGHDDGAVDVDAHQGGRRRVLRDGPDGRAQLGAHHEEVQADHHEQRRADDHHVEPLEAQRLGDGQRHRLREDGRHRVGEDAHADDARTVYCRKNEAPMAVMSSTSRGELRSGR